MQSTYMPTYEVMKFKILVLYTHITHRYHVPQRQKSLTAQFRFHRFHHKPAVKKLRNYSEQKMMMEPTTLQTGPYSENESKF